MKISKNDQYLLTQENNIKGANQIWNISKTEEAPQG